MYQQAFRVVGSVRFVADLVPFNAKSCLKIGRISQLVDFIILDYVRLAMRFLFCSAAQGADFQRTPSKRVVSCTYAPHLWTRLAAALP